ncbi:MAG: MFS transporter [Pseudomonadota bacterium]
MTNTSIQSAPSFQKSWQTPTLLLMAMAGVMQIAFAAWMALTNNFAVEVLSFTGREIGIQQSIREIPGFLSFAAVFLLLLGREQTWAYISLLLLGGAAAVTGMFPSFTGFLITTFISSIGFHYYETMHQSLSLQWLPKKTAPATMGKILSVSSVAQLMVFGFIFVAGAWFAMSFNSIYMITGLFTVLATLVLWLVFPAFKDGTPQHKKLILRKRYWLYYALTFMGGARRQIFMVFAAFMMVERFGFEIHEVMGLMIANQLMTMFLAPMIGKWIVRFGERTILTVEYIGLIIVFVAYAFVPSWELAVALYLIDHAFFAMAISQKTYFQKIADPADIAPTAGVAFTINHIAAVFIPVLFGLIWLWSPAAVFLAGAGMAFISLVLARMVSPNPDEGNEFVWSNVRAKA